MINVYFKTLGCPKNEVDSDYMKGFLNEHEKFILTKDPNRADVIVLNTCGFINDAKEESIEAIFNAIYYKQNKNCSAVIVTGCLTQRYKKTIVNKIPEIDAILGTGNFDKLPEVIEKVLNNKKFYEITNPSFDYNSELPRNLSNKNTAYLKIAEGCNNNCTYCTIPQIRGKLNSRKINDIFNEAKQLVENGVKEIIIIAQDITQYGIDIYGQPKLVPLLEKLIELKKIEWIRLMYTYPERINDNLIQLISSEEKICNYLDLPIQHSSKKIRKKMGRKGNKNDIIKLINKLRIKVPDIAIRTSLIVGFPGEEKSDFDNLLKFIKKIKFERLGVFQYSREEDTPAFHMDNQIKEDIKEKRYQKIMEEQQKISLLKNKKMVNKKIKALITGYDDGYYLARSQYDAPEIDNQIYIIDDNLNIGDFILCEIKDAYEYDLFAKKIRRINK